MRTVICFVMVLVCAPVVWGQAITGFTGGSQYDSYYGDPAGDVVGWRFTVTEQLEITALGVWNNDLTGGIESPHQVGIWDESQTLITSVSVDNTGTVVTDWIYASITPLIVNSGETYTIGALYFAGDNDYYISSASSMTTDPSVTWLNAVYPTGGDLGFVYPGLDSAASSRGRFGPNFIFDLTPLERTSWGAIKASSF